MQRDIASEGGNRKQQIERYADDISQPRNGTECLLEDIRQSDEYKRWSRVGIDTDRKCRREDEQTSKYCHDSVYCSYLQCRISEVCLTLKITGVGAYATHCNAERIEWLPKSLYESAVVYLWKVRFEQELYTFGWPR